MTIIQTTTQITGVTVGSFEITVLEGSKSRNYKVIFGVWTTTVVTGNANRFKFGGKVFHNDSEIGTHYKRDGKLLLEAVTEARNETKIVKK
jgi:hypothetical protein